MTGIRSLSKPVRNAQLRKRRALDLHLGLDLEKEYDDVGFVYIFLCQVAWKRDKLIISGWGQGKFLASMSQTIEMTEAYQKPKKMSTRNLIRIREQEAWWSKVQPFRRTLYSREAKIWQKKSETS